MAGPYFPPLEVADGAVEGRVRARHEQEGGAAPVDLRGHGNPGL